MRYKYEYSHEVDRQDILNNNEHLFLIEEQNITEGNFLVFSDEPVPERIVYVNVPEEDFKALKERQSATEMAVFQLMTEEVK